MRSFSSCTFYIPALALHVWPVEIATFAFGVWYSNTEKQLLVPTATALMWGLIEDVMKA